VQSVRESGRRTTCKSNLKQIGIAFQMYLDRKSRGKFPDAAVMPSFEILTMYQDRPLKPSIMSALGPFIESSRETFRCPSDSVYYVRSGTKADEIRAQLTLIQSGTDAAAKQIIEEFQSQAYEGTSYEYPARRLANKTREQALTSSRLGSNLATSKLWVLYEFDAFHATGWAALFAPDVSDTNKTDDGRDNYDQADWTPPEGARNFLYFDGHVENL
jgi:prepilin-type processing-associated H-X9-DG protein